MTNQSHTDLAARKLAECMDYPWEHMPEAGRNKMREHAKAILAVDLESPERVAITDEELADCVPEGAHVIEREGERNRVSMTRAQLHQFANSVRSIGTSATKEGHEPK